LVRLYSQDEFPLFNEFLRSAGFATLGSLPLKTRWTDPVTGRTKYYDIDEQWFLPRSDVRKSRMFYVIQKFSTKSGLRVRVGYYKIGRRPRSRGRWVYGQSCPWYRMQDLRTLLPLLKRLTS
jgi:hypothetical protein